MNVAAFGVIQMDGAGQAGIKGVDGAQDFNGLLDVRHRGTDERGLEGAALLLAIAGGTVPRGRHHQLVVVDLSVVNLDLSGCLPRFWIASRMAPAGYFSSQ